MLQIVLLHALYGLSIPIQKITLQYAAPFFTCGIRMTIGGSLLFMFSYFFEQRTIAFRRKNAWIYVQIIICMFLKYVLRSWSLQYMSCVRMAFILNLSPFIAAALSYFVLHETLSNKKWVGITIGSSASLLPLAFNTSTNNIPLIFLSDISLGLAICAHFYSLLLMQQLMKADNPVTLTNSIRMLAGGVLTLGTSCLTEEMLPIYNPLPFVGYIIVLFVLSNVICYHLYVYLLKTYSITLLSLTDNLIPFFTALYGWALLNESICIHYLYSTCILLCATYLFYQDELKTVKAVKKTPKIKSACLQP